MHITIFEFILGFLEIKIREQHIYETYSFDLHPKPQQFGRRWRTEDSMLWNLHPHELRWMSNCQCCIYTAYIQFLKAVWEAAGEGQRESMHLHVPALSPHWKRSVDHLGCRGRWSLFILISSMPCETSTATAIFMMSLRKSPW